MPDEKSPHRNSSAGDPKAVAGKSTPPAATVEEVYPESPVVKLVNLIVARGAFEGASDIYLYEKRDAVMVRYRIDGILVDGLILPIKAWNSVRQRLLVLADLDFVSRKPQTGTIRLIIEKQPYTFRLTNAPSGHTDHIAIRLYRPALPVSPPSELGFTDELLALLDGCLLRPGLTLLTGPPGAGCTTTAYALLRRTERDTRYCAVYEEYESYPSFGAATVYRNPLQPVSLRDTVSAFLAQGASLLFLGNLEDADGLLAAIEAAERGIPVLAIFQAQDTAHALERLHWKGIPPDRSHRVISAVVAQRLLRRRCNFCKSSGEVKGCDRCRWTGYRGQFAVFEAQTADNALGPNTWSLQTPDLRDGALAQVRNGKMTVEEVNRVMGSPLPV